MESETEVMESFVVDPHDGRVVSIEEIQMDGTTPPSQAPTASSHLPSHITPGSRYEKSLGLLTTRFVALLQKAKDGVLDLKEVSLRSGVD